MIVHAGALPLLEEEPNCTYFLTIPPPGTVVGGSLGNATLKLRQYPRIREYQVLSRVSIGQRPLIGSMKAWCYKYRDRQLCRGGIVSFLSTIIRLFAQSIGQWLA
jgi:hypothetical protein